MVDYCDNPTYGSNCDTFYLSKSASVLSSIQGCIVGMSSILTLTVIYRSQIRLSSVYHRIMCSMSVMDLIASIAMALSTIPMPKDQIYPFEGAMIYGTTVTCEIQGFAYVVGFAGSSLYFCGLCCFYLCIINFRMSDKAIRTYLEPTIHLVSTGVPLACSVLLYVFDLFNPSPHEAWCTISMYPWDCTTLDGVECIRGGDEDTMDYVSFIVPFFAGLILFGFVVVIIAMGLIIHGACKDNSKDEEIWTSIKKNLTLQALMYIVAYVFVWIFPILALFSGSPIIQSMRLACIHLQGLINSTIFIYHKAKNVMRADVTLTFWQALNMVLIKPSDVPEIKLAGLSIISNDNTVSRSQLPSIEEGVEDASKAMHLSHAEKSAEVNFMFDYHKNPKSSNKEELQGSAFSEESSKDIFNDSDVSFSEHDASTIRASNW